MEKLTLVKVGQDRSRLDLDLKTAITTQKTRYFSFWSKGQGLFFNYNNNNKFIYIYRYIAQEKENLKVTLTRIGDKSL